MNTTDFGFTTVPIEEKEKKVQDIFHNVASKYDLMNDLMSLGIHRIWKHIAVEFCKIKPQHKILDLAAGSGDLAKYIYPKIQDGQIILADLNDSMLKVGRDRIIDAGAFNKTKFVQANAENLPFKNDTFDRIIMAFGLRNVTDKLKALKSMYKVCKPGGKLLILEFTTPPSNLVKSIYDLYSFSILPKLGELVANDAESYQYLAESIRMHPDAPKLKIMIEDAGFEDCKFHLFSAGIVALHIAYKY